MGGLAPSKVRHTALRGVVTQVDISCSAESGPIMVQGKDKTQQDDVQMGPADIFHVSMQEGYPRRSLLVQVQEAQITPPRPKQKSPRMHRRGTEVSQGKVLLNHSFTPV